MGLKAERQLFKGALKRVAKIKFGDKITNISAGEEHLMRHCYYVRGKTAFVECTNGKGDFSDYSNTVIYPGWISQDESKELFKPVWEAEHDQ